nr:helicase-related protein [Angustibacter aerolatus]
MPVLDGLRLGLLHGRLPVDEREATMAAFARGEIDVLVATTVVEVGVDVPNSTVMVVMDADRFGISQAPACAAGSGGERARAGAARHRRTARDARPRAARRRGVHDRRVRAWPASTSSCAARATCWGPRSPASGRR